MTSVRRLTAAELALDCARQRLQALSVEIDAIDEGRGDTVIMREIAQRLERDLAALAGCPSAHDLNTRHALPEAGDSSPEVDEPAVGDAFTEAYAAHERADSDRMAVL